MNEAAMEIVEEYDVTEATSLALMQLCGDDLDFLRVSLEEAEELGI